MKKLSVIWILLAGTYLMAGCGKSRTCFCLTGIAYEIIDTALVDSLGWGTIPLSTDGGTRESTVECSYWNEYDTVGQYLPDLGLQAYSYIECHEK